MFKKASKFTTGNITHVEAGTYVDNTVRDSSTTIYNNHPTPSNPLKDLSDHVAVGALNNSAERHDAPKCHEDTRVAVQQDIFSWMRHGAQPQRLLWLSGPAGAGKTAIMGTIADECQRRGQLAGSFFFSVSSASPDQRSKRYFVTTLAYQLQQDGTLKEATSSMLASIISDPVIFQKSLKEQVEVLILNPLRVSRGSYDVTKIPRAILIDGLDECDESLEPTGPDQPVARRTREDNQTEILSVLLQALDDPAFPFQIVLASRPEPWIRRFFDSPSTAGRAAEIFLDNNYNPDKDIALFLRSKFAELRRRYNLPQTWPGEGVIMKLVENASGQFIYAATVMRFLKTPSDTPQVQLDILLSLRPQDLESPFGPLDALYTRALLSSAKPRLAFIWLRAHQVMTYVPGVELPAWLFNCLCESSLGEAQLVLGSLPSLVQISDPTNAGDYASYTFYHKSFLDYLGDSTRCQSFPELGEEDIKRWISDRFGQILIRGGPEVYNDWEFIPDFKEEFFALWFRLAAGNSSPLAWISDHILSQADHTTWIAVSCGLRDRDVGPAFRRDIFVLVHKNCRRYAPCRPACKAWRGAIFGILDKPPVDTSGCVWDRETLVKDRFCFQRIPSRPMLRERRILSTEAVHNYTGHLV